MATTKSPIDEYIAEFPPETQKVLKQLRTLIKKTVPAATERISYGIPTFDLNGKYLIYFAGWKKYVSLYPITGAVEKAFAEEIKPYKKGKGTLQFPLEERLPTDLIRRIVKFKVKQASGK
jgi:uncharacterized protein YdhG (YjbR/CyaY superfamily)